MLDSNNASIINFEKNFFLSFFMNTYFIKETKYIIILHICTFESYKPWLYLISEVSCIDIINIHIN